MKTIKIGLAILLMLIVGAGIFIGSGLYNPGADSPHWKATHALMQTVRTRAVEQHAAAITVPANLDDPQQVRKGAGQYDAMCASCHLAPGMEETELRAGLYPRPPNLSEARVDPREAFWVIKHGIKMSAMPAWGITHDDAIIWSMVAFLQKLPDMTAAQYKTLAAEATPHGAMESTDNATIPPSRGHTHGEDGHGVH